MAASPSEREPSGIPTALTPEWLEREAAKASAELADNDARMTTRRAAGPPGVQSISRPRRFLAFRPDELSAIGVTACVSLDTRRDLAGALARVRPSQRRLPLSRLVRSHPNVLKRGIAVASGLTRERTCPMCLARFVTTDSRQLTCSGRCQKRRARGLAVALDGLRAVTNKVTAKWDRESRSGRSRQWSSRELDWHAAWTAWLVARHLSETAVLK